MRVARQAGTMQANKLTVASSTPTEAYVAASVGRTPKIMVEITRANVSAPAIPITTPLAHNST